MWLDMGASETDTSSTPAAPDLDQNWGSGLYRPTPSIRVYLVSAQCTEQAGEAELRPNVKGKGLKISISGSAELGVGV